MTAVVGALEVVLTGNASQLSAALKASGTDVTVFEQQSSRSFQRVDAAMGALGKSSGLSRVQLQMFGHEAKASFDMLAAGASPLRVLSMEGIQLADAFAMGPRGVGGTIAALGEGFVNLLTPVNLAVAAVAALGIGGVMWLTHLRSDADVATQSLADHSAWLAKILKGYTDAATATKTYEDAVDKLPKESVESNLNAGAEQTKRQYDAALQALRDFKSEAASEELKLYVTADNPMTTELAQAEALNKLKAAASETQPYLDGVRNKLQELINSHPDDTVGSVAEKFLTLVDNARDARAEIGANLVALNKVRGLSPLEIDIGIVTKVAGDGIAILKALAPDLRTDAEKAHDALSQALGAPDAILRNEGQRQYTLTVAALDAQKKQQAALKAANGAASADRQAQQKIDGVNSSLDEQISNLTATNRQLEINTELTRAGVTADSAAGIAISAKAAKYFDEKTAIEGAANAANFLAQTTESAFESVLTGSDSVVGAFGQIATAIGEAALQAALLGSGPLSGLFGTAPTTTGGAGGLLGSLFSSIGFDAGGYTGNGSRMQPAGIVHAGEYVFDAKSTMRAGVANLAALHSRLKGYSGGGLVGGTAPGSFDQSLAGMDITLGVSVDQNGTLKPFVESVTRKGLGQYDSALPDRMAQIHADPRKRSARR